jgi:hypothetical protein
MDHRLDRPQNLNKKNQNVAESSSFLSPNQTSTWTKGLYVTKSNGLLPPIPFTPTATCR